MGVLHLEVLKLARDDIEERARLNASQENNPLNIN